jgi:hypothetical protein
VQLGFRALVVAVLVLLAPLARAEVVSFETSHTIYHEAPTRTKMTVYTPGADLSVTPTEWLVVRAGYEADVLSGASVAVKAGPAYAATHPGTDVVTAASVKDTRHQGRGGFTLKKENVTFTTNYAYSTEHDYRSHALNVTARTEAYEHDTQLEISYARNWDGVCDRTQSPFDTAPRFRALEDSVGCFTSNNPIRSKRDLGIDGFQASWSQAWTPVFMTQLVYTAQILNGFQSNPYRSVILGEGLKAQEHHPENRARHALALRANFFIKPFKAAVRVGVRAYDDSWKVRSGTAEVELEKYFTESLRAMVRARFYKQSGALFWSDDYTGGDPPLGPKGQYWTGDRELSPFFSWSIGQRVMYTIAPEGKRLLGLMQSLKFGGSFDLVSHSYDEYTLGGEPVTGATAYIGTLTLTALF